MKLIPVNCQNCSAPLEVPDDAKYVTCRHCDAQLTIKHTGSVAYTQVLDEIKERTERIEKRLMDLQRGSEVERLDREWAEQKLKFMISDKHGNKRMPTVGGSIIGGIIIVGFGIFWTIMAFGATSSVPDDFPVGGLSSIFPCFGVLFILFGAAMSIYSYMKAKDFLEAERRFRKKRTEAERKEGE